jgi:hypothetical protein
MVNKVLKQALELQDVFLAARPEWTPGHTGGSQSTLTREEMTDNLGAGPEGGPAPFKETAPMKLQLEKGWGLEW